LRVESNAEVPVEAPVTPPAAEQAPVVVIPRTLFNYAVIAVVCLVLGVGIGVLGYDRLAQQSRVSNEALINKAVATAVAALPRDTAAAAAGPDPNTRYTVATENRPAIGSPDAPVTIVEFGDFRCGYCKRFHEETITPLLENYGEQVRFVYRDYPILGPDSQQAAYAATCAHDQGAFWEFHDLLYANQSQLNRVAFLSYAESLELDVERFTTCYDEGTLNAEVIQDYNDGVALGITGTPTFFINGKIFIGAQPYAQFAAAIDAELSAISDAEQAS
jgi:protein-disulfide isomerase